MVLNLTVNDLDEMPTSIHLVHLYALSSRTSWAIRHAHAVGSYKICTELLLSHLANIATTWCVGISVCWLGRRFLSVSYDRWYRRHTDGSDAAPNVARNRLLAW
jgi:hypothetical protein